MSACAPLRIDDGASLAGALESLDCQVNGAVASGYGHVFGAHSVLGAALTTALTLYVAILALGLITGRTRLTLRALGPRMLSLGFILAFATAWPARWNPSIARSTARSLPAMAMSSARTACWARP